MKKVVHFLGIALGIYEISLLGSKRVPNSIVKIHVLIAEKEVVEFGELGIGELISHDECLCNLVSKIRNYYTSFHLERH
jgi:hypothetical protein